jgi:hypothetical protein
MSTGAGITGLRFRGAGREREKTWENKKAQRRDKNLQYTLFYTHLQWRLMVHCVLNERS